MAVVKQVGKYAGNKLTRRLTRSIPWIGAVFAMAALGSAVKRKGLVRGALHTALDVIPYVGGAKNIAEMVRGRDFFPDKVVSAPVSGAAAASDPQAPVPAQPPASSRA